MPVSQRAHLVRLLPYLAHCVLVLFVFAPVLFTGRMFYVRDVSISYYPDYVFLHGSLGKGTWPLWNPTSDAGAPFFASYPVVVLLVAVLGPAIALGVGPAFHVLLAMCGTTALARARGAGPWGGWLAGAILGLSGYLQSSLLFPVFLAAAWTPWILLVHVRLRESPTARRAAALAALVALQLSTLGGEIVLQTGLLALFLGLPLSRRAWKWYLVAGAVAALLSAPVLLGLRAVLEGTPRGAGFAPEEGLAFSAPWPVLLEALWPRFLGNTHTFSDYGFWGQPLFPDGYPFFLSLYLGPLAILLALNAGRERRLWLVAALGVLLSLGAHGPLAVPLAALMHTFRVPVKFFFLTSFAVALLAGRGFDRALRAVRVPPTVLLPGMLLLLLSAALSRDPSLAARLLSGVLPELADWRARVVASTDWPVALLRTGALGVAGGLALLGGRRVAPLAGIAVMLDVLVVTLPLNPTAERSFYELRPEVRKMVHSAAAEGQSRFFSYGLTATPPVRFEPRIAGLNTDYWLYAMERQSVLPRSHVLDGLEGAFDEDRNGLLPLGATLLPTERDPRFFAHHFRRLQLANVRFVLSYRPLPDDLVSPRGEVRFPEIADSLLLFELRDPLPRAFWVGEIEVLPAGASASPSVEDPGFDPRRKVVLAARPPEPPPSVVDAAPSMVRFEQEDPHTVRIRAESPAGMIVVSQGYDPAWRAEVEGREEPLIRANGRYLALWTPGGSREWTLRYRPRWLAPSLALLATGLIGCLALLATAPPSKNAA
jgi:hypothetical protein